MRRDTSKGNDLSTLLESRLAEQDHRIEQLEQKISDVLMFNRYLEQQLRATEDRIVEARICVEGMEMRLHRNTRS